MKLWTSRAQSLLLIKLRSLKFTLNRQARALKQSLARRAKQGTWWDLDVISNWQTRWCQVTLRRCSTVRNTWWPTVLKRKKRSKLLTRISVPLTRQWRAPELWSLYSRKIARCANIISLASNLCSTAFGSCCSKCMDSPLVKASTCGSWVSRSP